MPDITIPDAAVEAAAQASYNHLRAEDDGAVLTPWEGYHDKEWWRAFIRVELAAAAPYIAAQALRDMGEWFDRAAQLGTGERDVIAAQACYDRADRIEAGNG